jgi:hypothetical protein
MNSKQLHVYQLSCGYVLMFRVIYRCILVVTTYTVATPVRRSGRRTKCRTCLTSYRLTCWCGIMLQRRLDSTYHPRSTKSNNSRTHGVYF